MIFMINKIFLYVVKFFYYESIYGLLNNCSDIRGGKIWGNYFGR